ncbi:hypothetical protein DFH07DRAFT_952014 [Mycena maculata]|uniref:Uncharacterized protein n=1 Tax=Mycena maculata TaxID=230809 RepID=A0AAD7K0A6_9AGAR|nr:hypothetical protein DFH07DRAFT_952014 [Mycena maculata]
MASGDLTSLLQSLARPTTSSPIPSAVLDTAPHLSRLSSPSTDPNLHETQKIHHANAADNCFEVVIDLLCAQPLDMPLPWSIWNGIIRDSHIEFSKLLTSTNSTYDHADKPIEFRGDFVLVKQHELVAILV